jgi:hypothetical protein
LQKESPIFSKGIVAGQNLGGGGVRGFRPKKSKKRKWPKIGKNCQKFYKVAKRFWIVFLTHRSKIGSKTTLENNNKKISLWF